jgi:hypothetical protein
MKPVSLSSCYHPTVRFASSAVQMLTMIQLNKLQIFKNPCLVKAGNLSFALFFQLQNK